MKRKLFSTVLCVSLALSMVTGCGKSTEKKDVDYASLITYDDYSKISLEKSKIDEEVQGRIDQNMEGSKSYETVKKGKVKDGDTVNIYYVGKIDGKEFQGGSLTKDSNPDGYDLTIGSGSFIPGFESQLIGKKIGSTSDIKVKFPDDYQSEEVKGKEALFTVTINSKQGKEIVPKFDDKFVKENIDGYDTVDAYKTYLRGEVVKDMAWSKINDSAKVKKYPKDMLKTIKKQITTNFNYYLEQMGADLDKYLSSTNMTKKDFEKQKDDTAKGTLKDKMFSNAIAEKEKLKVSDKEYKAEVKKIMEANGCKDEAALDQMFKTYYGCKAKDIIMDDLLKRKVQEVLAGNVEEK